MEDSLDQPIQDEIIEEILDQERQEQDQILGFGFFFRQFLQQQNQLNQLNLSQSQDAMDVAQLQEEISNLDLVTGTDYEEEDKIWLNIPYRLWDNEILLNDKYYEALIQLGQYIIEEEDEEEELAFSSNDFDYLMDRDDLQLNLSRLSQNLHKLGNITTFSQWLKKKLKVSERFLVAQKREIQRREKVPHSSSAPLQFSEPSSTRHLETFLSTGDSSKATQFLASSWAHKTPLTLKNEDKNLVAQFQNDLVKFLPQTSNDNAARGELLSALTIVGLCAASVSALVFAIQQIIKEFMNFESINSSWIPLARSLKRLNRFRQYSECTALIPESFLGSFRLYFTPYSKQHLSYRRPIGNLKAISIGVICTDGTFIYLHNEKGLIKLGSGFNGTIRGNIYQSVHGFQCKDKNVEMVCIKDKLIYSSTETQDYIEIIDCHSLKKQSRIQITKNYTKSITKRRLTSNGNQLFFLYETSDKRYLAEIFDFDSGILFSKLFLLKLKNSLLKYLANSTITYSNTVQLKLPDPISSCHDSVTCHACHRVNFKSKLYRCKVCNIELCEVCNFSKNRVDFSKHAFDHLMDIIDLPSEESTENSKNNTKKKKSPPPVPVVMTPDAFDKSGIYVTDNELGFLIPPQIQPNKRTSSICRIFELSSGILTEDYDTTSTNLGFSTFYDRVNNILWNYSNVTQNFTYWRSIGSHNTCLTSWLQNFNSTFLPEKIIAKKEYLLSENSETVNPKQAIAILLANLDLLSRNAYPFATKDGPSHPSIFPFQFQHFSGDISPQLFSQLVKLLDDSIQIYVKTIDYPPDSLIVYSIIVSLRLIKINFHHWFNQPQNMQEIYPIDKNLIDQLLNLILQLFKFKSSDDSEIDLQKEACELIIIGFELFFPLPDQQAEFIQTQLLTENSLSPFFGEYNHLRDLVFKALISSSNDFLFKLNQKILLDKSDKPSSFLSYLLQVAEREFKDNLTLLVQNANSSTLFLNQSSSTIQLLETLQNYLWISVESNHSLISFFSNLLIRTCLSLLSFILQIFSSEISQRVFSDESFQQLMENSIFGQVLSPFLISLLRFWTIQNGPFEISIKESLLNLIRHLDKLNSALHSSCLAEATYLNNPIPVYESILKIFESSHPYVPNDKRDVTISIPGACCLCLTFDKECCTEGEQDFLQIISNGKPISKKFYGNSESSHWPNSTLIIPGSSIVIRFNSQQQTASKNHRWGFKISIEGIISTPILGLPILLTLQKMCVALFSEFVATCITNTIPNLEEQELFSNPLLLCGLEDSSDSLAPEFDLFLEDLIQGQKEAYQLNSMIISIIEKKILKVPPDYQIVVEQSCRIVLGVLLKFTGLIKEAIQFCNSSPSVENTPSHLLELWNFVYVTQFRQWMKLEVQMLSNKGIAIGEAYETVCSKVNAIGKFLLKFTPSSTPSLNQILNFFKLDINSSILEKCFIQRIQRANQRKLGYQLIQEVFEASSLPSTKQDLVLPLTQTMKTINHFSKYIEGCGKNLLHQLYTQFYQMLSQLTLCLNNKEYDSRLQLLVLKLLSIQFQPEDSKFLNWNNYYFINSLFNMATGQSIQVWKLSEYVQTKLHNLLPARNSCLTHPDIGSFQQLIGDSARVGQNVGPIVPPKEGFPPPNASSIEAFSLTLWVYPLRGGNSNLTSSWRTLVFKGTDGGVEGVDKTRSPALFFSIEDLSIALCVSTKSNWNVCLRSNSEVPFSVWTHISCIYGKNKLQLYLNGQLDSEMQLTEPVLFNFHPFCIGTTPKNLNDKPGFNGFIESCIYFHSNISEEFIRKLSFPFPLPPQIDTKEEANQKKICFFSRNLIQYLSTLCLMWDPIESIHSLQQLLLTQLFTTLQTCLSNCISNHSVILSSSSNDNLSVHSKSKSLTYATQLLILLNRITLHSSVGKNYLSQQSILQILFKFLQSNIDSSIQLLLFRLLRHLLVNVTPSHLTEAIQQDCIEFFLEMIGQFFYPDSNISTDQPTSSEYSSPKIWSAPSSEWLVIIYWMEGISQEEYTNLLLTCKEISPTIVKELASEAHEMNKAVVFSGTKEECSDLGKKLGALGFTVHLIERPLQPPLLDTQNQPNSKVWRSGQASFAKSAELVMLCRLLWKNSSQWKQALNDHFVFHLSNLFALINLSPSNSEFGTQYRKTLGSLAIISLSDGFREGGKVSCHQYGIGTLLHYDRFVPLVEVLFDDNSKPTEINISHLHPVPEHHFSGYEFNFSIDVYSQILSIMDPSIIGNTLPNFSSIPVLTKENIQLFSTIRFYSTKSLALLLESSQAVEILAQAIEQGKLPSLITLAQENTSTTYNKKLIGQDREVLQEKMQCLLQNYYQIALSPKKFEAFIDINPPTNNSNKNTKENLASLFPYNPYFQNSSLSSHLLPQTFDVKGKILHHVLFNEDNKTAFFYGNPSDELFLTADQPIPTNLDFYYFEVQVLLSDQSANEETERTESTNSEEILNTSSNIPAPPPPPLDSSKTKTPPTKKCDFSVGLCPANSSPTWDNGCLGFHPKGEFSSSINLDLLASQPRYVCPYCGIDDLTERNLCFHIVQRHSLCPRRVVCPICAASPFGNPNYYSSDIQGHIKERHRNKLPANICPEKYDKYGIPFGASGDIVGCGWTKEGGIFFTLNGKYLGLLITNQQDSFLPLVSLRTSNTQAIINFGQLPYAFNPFESSQKEKILEEQTNLLNSKKAERETQLLKERAEREEKLARRMENGVLLQSFVGFHIKYCLYALEKANDNVEQAAEWAMSHLDSVSQEHPELFLDDSEESKEDPMMLSEESEIRETLLQSKGEEDENNFSTTCYNLGFSYSLSDTSLRHKSNIKDPSGNTHTSNIESIAIGQVLKVVKVFEQGRNWIPDMQNLLHRLGIVKYIDVLRMQVLLKFYNDREEVEEQWWIPLHCLEKVHKTGVNSEWWSLLNPQEIPNQIQEIENIVTLLHLTQAASLFILNIKSLNLRHIGGAPQQLKQVFHLLAREYFSDLYIPFNQSLSSSSISSSTVFLFTFQTHLRKLCQIDSPPISEIILCDVFDFIEKVAEIIAETSVIIESDHPHSRASSELVTPISISQASGLFLNFYKKSQIHPKERLEFYLDSELSQCISYITVEKGFSPVQFSHNSIWMKLVCSNEAKNGKYWGWKFLVAPKIPEFNMAIWLLEFLLQVDISKIKNLHSRIFKSLFNFLYTQNVPVELKVICLRVLTQILQEKGLPANDIRSSDPMQMRDTMASEMSQLLVSAQKSPVTLSSPYLQSLVELMVEMKRSLQSSSLFSLNEVKTSSLSNPSSFENLLELSSLLPGIKEKNCLKLPNSFLMEASKHLQSTEEQIFIKVTQPFLSFSIWKEQLQNVFSRFDVDQDGFLNFDELSSFYLSIGTKSLTTEQFESLIQQYEKSQDKKGISLEGFLEWKKLEMQQHPVAFCCMFHRLGYDPCGHQHNYSMGFESTSSPSMNAIQWSIEMDEELISLVNTLWEKTGIDSLLLPPSAICISNQDRKTTYRYLSHVSIKELRIRFVILKKFNQMVSSALPLIDLTRSHQPHSLAGRLVRVKELLFYSCKLSFLKEMMKHTTTTQTPPTIYLSRLAATKNIFQQAMDQLHHQNPILLRQVDRSFKVVLQGENAEGEVGPFREALGEICKNLQSSNSPLLIPCPNQQLANDTIGVGENREKWIINPGAKSSKELNMFEFFGKLIGVAIRSNTPLTLDLPSFFWKPLIGEKITKQDLKEIDHSTCTSLESLEGMNQETFQSTIFENFSTLLSDKITKINLKENGENENVSYENRMEFINLKYQVRCNEAQVQQDCIIRGLGSVISISLFCLFTWKDMRYLVCGKPEIDLHLLERHTQYRGVSPTDQHIRFFWNVLRSFSATEQTLFLKFAWGRERLPPETLFNEEMKIFPINKENQDSLLPHADTCFFNLHLPKYSSEELMKEKLLIAITHAGAMDGDVRRSDDHEFGSQTGPLSQVMMEMEEGEY